MEQEDNKSALMNESALQIQRLNNLWQRAAYNREKGYFLKYQTILELVEDELTWDMKDLDIKHEKKEDNGYSFKEDLEKLDLEIDKAFLSGLIKTNYLKKLRKKEILLRKIQQECGKGSKYVDPGADEVLD